VTSIRSAAAVIVLAAVMTGCSLLADPDEEYDATGRSFVPSVSLTEAGVSLAGHADLEESAPRYDVVATVDPGTGSVKGTVQADLPVGTDIDVVHLRYFAGLPDFKADARLGVVTVDDEPAEVRRDSSIVTVPLPAGHQGQVTVRVPFSYTLRPSQGGGSILDALGGMGGPAEVGLLARQEDALNLGHWFPVWIPEGNSVDPEPAGYGDIGNFPAALMRLQLSVPKGWTVVDGGVRVAQKETGPDEVTVVSEGYGMNDLAVALLHGYAVKRVGLDGRLDGVTVSAYAPRKDRGELAGVLDETTAALETLSERFGPYPWREFDIVSAPLGAGVGGMEWPGATWIEPSLFAGGLPGLGGLEDLLGSSGLDGLDSLGGLGGLGGDTGRMIQTLRKWTIAHEVGHEWWHIVVGNDSVLDPVVDEPLAQYSACLVLRETEPGDVDSLCEAHIDSGYEQMRMLGDQDSPANRATDEFASSGQYAGVVYGKAAAFYLALEDAFGRAQVADALAEVAHQRAFTMVTAADLRAALADELDDPARFDRLWTRWMERARGDRDLAVDPSTGLGGLEGLGGLMGADGADAGELQDLLDQFLSGLETQQG
jgi:hypothetical protein